MNSIRVRFAPSPTGYLHIGGARTALFNYLFARHNKGTMILRIEDTDIERSTDESSEAIIESLKWLGIDWDEGPIYQSQRMELYKREIARLLEINAAYPCFCSEERLNNIRDEAKKTGKPFVYDKHCLSLSQDEIKRRIENGEKYVIRFRVPDSGITKFDDEIVGDTTFENSLIGDFVIVRSDGNPTYNLTAAIDDADMKITHIIRGDDHISNTPKQILIYEALGYPIPIFAHVPLILGKDRTRLSKRHGATSVLQFRDAGFLSEAMVNFLSLLGWSPGDSSQEIFSKEELIEKFSLERITKSAAVFDTVKLEWMNGVYIRQLPKEVIIKRVKEFFIMRRWDTTNFDNKWFEGIVSLEIERSKTLLEFEDHLKFFLVAEPDYDESAIRKYLTKPEVWDLLTSAQKTIGNTSPFDVQTLEINLRKLASELNISFGKIVHPLRVVLTGRTASPGIFDVIFYLGKEKTISRIETAQKNFADQIDTKY